MALRKATYTGVNNIVDGYKAANADGKYYYSVWLSDSDIAFQCMLQDADKAEELLHNNLTALKQSGNTDLFYLKLHPTELADKKAPYKYIDRKTPVIGTIPFRVIDLEESGVAGQSFTPGTLGRSSTDILDAVRELPAKFKEQLDPLEARILALEGEDDSEPEPEPGKKIMGYINGIASNPQLMSMIGQVLSYLRPVANQVATGLNRINGMTAQPQQQEQQQPGSAEVRELDNELINASLIRLNQHCELDTDLKLLADMAESNPGQFKMLLTMLRAQK